MHVIQHSFISQFAVGSLCTVSELNENFLLQLLCIKSVRVAKHRVALIVKQPHEVL